jgi:hypothetical protein
LVFITAKRPSTDQSEEWHCPACQLPEEQWGIWQRRTESKIWLANWESTWEAAKMIRFSPNYVKMAEEYKISTMSTSGIIIEPTCKNMDKPGPAELENPNSHTSRWKSTLGKHIRYKSILTCNLLTHNTNINGTGTCEPWNRQVGLIRPSLVQETTHDSEQYDTPSKLPQAED